MRKQPQAAASSRDHTPNPCFSMKLSTIAVHAGDRRRAGDFVPVTTPVYNASSFFYERMEDLDKVFGKEKEGQTYSRYGNPTTAALEEQVAALEGGGFAQASSSGMAAIYLALLAALADRRKSIVASNVLYGQTITLLMNVLEPAGVEVRFSDPCDLEAFETAVVETKPACVLMETISNPMMRVPALDRLAEITRRHGAALIIDSTFTTPALMRPLEIGADIVAHSATKYLAGHGDALGGVLIAGEEFRPALDLLGRTLGMNLGPFEAYLTMRGIKTLPLRVERQCRNAALAADRLKRHPRIERVHYPGDVEHPDHGTARRLLAPGQDGEARFGGMLSFEIKDADKASVFEIVDRLRLVVRATSLGDVHSMILHPATSSHRDLAPKHRLRLGIGDNLLRLSAGIEDPEDIIADLEQALDE